jgi:hypothetical protein
MRAGVLLGMLCVGFALPASAAAQGVDTTCQFSLTRLDATTTNVLAVDTNAVYWGGTYAALPGTRIRIEGQYPHSRYISWNVYDAAARPIDALSDVQLAPDPGSTNPFFPGASRTAEQRDYTAFIEVGPRPEQPAANTLYTGSSQGGTFLYRVYVPDAGRDAKGGVPLPRVTLESADGSGAPLGPEQCRELQAPYAQPLNDLIAGTAGLPDPTADGEGYPGRNPPDWTLFENLCSAAVDIMLDNESGESFYPGAHDRCGNGPGFLSNRDIAYVFAPTSRGFGELPRAARARADVRRHPAGARGDAGRAAAPLLVLLPVRARDPARYRLPFGRSCDRRARRSLHDRRLHGGQATRERAAGVRGHMAALGSADAGPRDLQAHAPRPVVRAGNPERTPARRRERHDG